MNDAKGKIRKAASAVAGGAVSQVVGDALAPDTPQAAAAPAAQPEAPHEWVPEVEQHTVTHGADGSVEAKTGTVWRPETHGTESAPADVPTIEEFEQIDIHEDAFGNFIIDATERVVVHNHGHDETYVDHQHLVVPGDGTPGDTDIDVVEREDVVVHENPDGTISVEHHGSLSVETHPDAPGHGDVEVWQEESVALDEAPTGPPGIEVGISEDEQARADDPFGEPAGPTIHQSETVGDKTRTATVTPQSSSAPVPAPAPVVTFARQPSTVDNTPLVAESGRLAATSELAEHPVAKHVEPRHVEPKPSFVTEPAPKHHDSGELAGPKAPDEPHHLEVPKNTEQHLPDQVPETHDQQLPEIPHIPEHATEEQLPDSLPVPDEHIAIHQAHADGGG